MMPITTRRLLWISAVALLLFLSTNVWAWQPSRRIDHNNNNNNNNNNHYCEPRRRLCLELATIGAACPSRRSVAMPLLGNNNSNNRRQLEVCLVNVQRVVYWAQQVVLLLNVCEFEKNPSAQYSYLQAKLGCKAILTGRVGPGAKTVVYKLSTLQIPACVNDLQWYCSKDKKRYYMDLKMQWMEGLASVVEFDGFDNLTDPSPRSSLTLSSWTPQKAIFVERTLREVVVPVGRQLLAVFEEESLSTANLYMEQNYADEIPSMQNASDGLCETT